MAIEFQQVVVRGRRRLRLVFSEALDTGAFSAAWYTVTPEDPAAAPAVVAAMIVATAAHNVELQLDTDLQDGALYTLTVAAGVPASGGSSTAAEVTAQFRPGRTTPSPSRDRQRSPGPRGSRSCGLRPPDQSPARQDFPDAITRAPPHMATFAPLGRELLRDAAGVRVCVDRQLAQGPNVDVVHHGDARYTIEALRSSDFSRRS